jgi:hypothetical protein
MALCGKIDAELARRNIPQRIKIHFRAPMPIFPPAIYKKIRPEAASRPNFPNPLFQKN